MILLDAVDEELYDVAAHLGGMDRHRGEHGLKEAGVLHVVDADHGHVVRHGDAFFLEQLHDAERGDVVGTDDGRAVETAFQRLLEAVVAVAGREGHVHHEAAVVGSRRGSISSGAPD